MFNERILLTKLERFIYESSLNDDEVTMLSQAWSKLDDDKWWSVDECLPNCDTYGIEVLAYLEKPIKNGERIVKYTYFNNQWLSINGSVYPGMPKPTHWKYLPKPPEDNQL